MAEGLDLVLNGLSHHGVQVGVQVHRGLVGEIIEDIGGSDSLGSSLFVAEYQVDPLVELARHELGLQRLSVDPHKLLRSVGPGRQLHVAHLHSVVQPAQSVAVGVDEHLRQVVELGDQLLHVAGVSLAVGPGTLHGAEESVGVVELPVLQGEEQAGERLQPDEPVEGEGCSGVVGAVVEGRDLVVLPRVVAILKVRLAGLVQGSDWLE